jgi:uncharacterized membrane protein YhaH (DUF805 family)
MTAWTVVVGYLAGRCARLEYWISAAVLAACNLVREQLPFESALALILFSGWLLLASRRLRDIGWSPWLCLAPLGLILTTLITFAVVASTVGMPDWGFNVLGGVIIVGWLGFWLAIGFPRSKTVKIDPDAQAEVFG